MITRALHGQLRTHAALFPPLPGTGIHQRPCLVNGFQAAGGMPCLCPAGVLQSPQSGLSCGLSPTCRTGCCRFRDTPLPQCNVNITRSSALLYKVRTALHKGILQGLGHHTCPHKWCPHQKRPMFQCYSEREVEKPLLSLLARETEGDGHPFHFPLLVQL